MTKLTSEERIPFQHNTQEYMYVMNSDTLGLESLANRVTSDTSFHPSMGIVAYGGKLKR